MHYAISDDADQASHLASTYNVYRTQLSDQKMDTTNTNNDPNALPDTFSQKRLIDKIKDQGTLRILLQGLAVALIFVVPFAEPSWHPDGWEIVLGAVIPAVAPISFILLMLDVMMCAVWKSDSSDATEVSRLGFAIKTHLVVGAVLILLWINSFSDALF